MDFLEFPVFNINESILAHDNAWKLHVGHVGHLRHSLPPYFATRVINEFLFLLTVLLLVL